MSSSPDRYTHGHHESVVSRHALRTAAENATYLLPYLRPGWRLLDAGCGPGTITTGLADAVAPGETIGLDIEPEVLNRARSHAGDHPHLAFAAGSVYELPYPDGAFDAAHAHQLLQHLVRPVDALAELRRVLRPGGVIGVCDSDYATMTAWPSSEAIDRWLALYHRVTKRNGAEADAGRRLPSWLRAAGFPEVTVTATTQLYTDREAVAGWGESWAERVTTSSLAEQALAYGFATMEELREIAAGWRAWTASPEAFFMFVHVQCVAHRPA